MRVRAWLLWLLMLAVPVYGLSSTQLRVLGPAHWHAGPPNTAASPSNAAAGWLSPVVQWVDGTWATVQQWREQAHLRAHALGQGHRHGTAHRHVGLQHHAHAPSDATVRVLDGADPQLSDRVAHASLGAALLPLAPQPEGWALPAATSAGVWPGVPAARWASASPEPALRPPRA